MNDFGIYLTEGVFSNDQEIQLFVSDGSILRNVSIDLDAYVGKRVRISAHHLPPSPIDPTAWGGGSCLCENYCPAGHHNKPTWLYNVSVEGEFSKRSPGVWVVSKRDGTEEVLSFGTMLPGHHGRIALATLFSVDQMRDKVLSSGQAESVTGLGTQVDELKYLMKQLKKVMRK